MTRERSLIFLETVNCEKVNTVGKLMGDKSYFYNVCYADSSHAVPGVIKMSLVIKNRSVLPGKEGEDRELFLCLFLLNCLQFKIILMPVWHILG